jgi:hypothetical protein
VDNNIYIYSNPEETLKKHAGKHLPQKKGDNYIPLSSFWVCQSPVYHLQALVLTKISMA